MTNNGTSIVTGLNKKELIDIIIKRKDTLLKHEQERNNLNLFNKQIELTIKEGIDPSELLFWKIFRNKFIFRKIMSNMNSHLALPYHSNVLVSYMLKCKQYDILRDKVITNQYLSFKPIGNIFKYQEDDDEQNENKPSDIYRLFYHIKSNKDSLFYKKLFQNYNNCIPNLQGEIIGAEEGELVSKIINSRCLVALIELEKLETKSAAQIYKPTQSNLEYAIGKGALKFIDYFLQPRFNLKVDFSKIDSTQVRNPAKLFKSLNHLFNNHSISITTTELNNFIQITTLNHSGKKAANEYDLLYDRNYIRQISIRSLVLITRFFLNFQNGGEDTSSFLKEIESFINNLSKEQLKLKLSDKCNQLEPNKSIIKKLLEFYYSFIKFEEMGSFYHLYFGEEDKRVDQLNYRDRDRFRVSFIFGDFKLFGNNLLELINNTVVTNTISNDVNSDDSLYNVFSHCTNKEKLLEFINSITGFITSKPNCENFQMGPIFIWYLIIECDDLELIKHASNRFDTYLTDPVLINNEDGTLKSSGALYGISRHIRSIDVLNWLYENHKIHFKLDCWWYFSDSKLLQHFETLYCTEHGGMDNIINNNLQFTQPNNGLNSYLSIEVLEYTIKSGSQLYKFADFVGVISLIANDFKLLKLFYLNYVHGNAVVTTIPFGEQGENTIQDCFSKFELIKFLDWLYTNYQYEFEKAGGILDGPLVFKQTLLFSISRYSTLDFVSSNISRWKIFQFGVPELLDLAIGELLSKCSTTSEDHNQTITESKLFQFILKAVVCGNLKSIEYINVNYVLLKTQSNHGLLGEDNLKKLLFKSLQLGLVQITNYLFDIVPISNDEFNKYSNKQYFKILY